jgi:hypothetical protein
MTQKKQTPFNPLQVKNKPHDEMQTNCAFILKLGMAANATDIFKTVCKYFVLDNYNFIIILVNYFGTL